MGYGNSAHIPHRGRVAVLVKGDEAGVSGGAAWAEEKGDLGGGMVVRGEAAGGEAAVEEVEMGKEEGEMEVKVTGVPVFRGWM